MSKRDDVKASVSNALICLFFENSASYQFPYLLGQLGNGCFVVTFNRYLVENLHMDITATGEVETVFGHGMF